LRTWHHKQRRSGPKSAPYILGLKAEVLRHNRINVQGGQTSKEGNDHAD
jgi:hypothetical protein